MSTLQQRLLTEERDPSSLKAIAATGWKQLLDVLRHPKWAFSGIIALILAVAGTYFYQERPLFDSALRPAPVATVSQGERITTPADSLGVRSQRFVRDSNRLLPSDATTTPARPMQQRYMLKQVSYTNASTSGGL